MRHESVTIFLLPLPMKLQGGWLDHGETEKKHGYCLACKASIELNDGLSHCLSNIYDSGAWGVLARIVSWALFAS